MTINDTSGQAHPYWYEWFVGLIEVVNLLNPDNEIESVAFQVASIRGWDDVLVYSKKGRRCYQVKHSRVDDSLTFGDFVQRDDKGESLLGQLFQGWKESGLDDGSTSLILYTNRTAGARWSTLENGKRRPPLTKFSSWLTQVIKEADSFSNVSVPDEFRDGWDEWIGSFDDKDESKAIQFLGRLEIRTQEEDLDGLESRIRKGLATAFGISLEKAAPLFDALTRELRAWTTGHPGVTIETLYAALASPPETKELAQAPPPPTPFFPTRIPVSDELENALLQDGESIPVVFLSGEPGSGKTSVVSWLANRRTDAAFQGVIGIRFFCFEPIRPEQPYIAPDSSRVKPEELWFSLLAQLRRGLVGRLHALQVPLSNAFLSWQKARRHVLRLADSLGKQLGRRFVISIDGIDHAARASQVLPEEIAAFFGSLPSPEELAATSIRLLIAGQPPEYHKTQYPLWLQGAHAGVRRFDLPKLDGGDIRALVAASKCQINATQIDECVRLIDELAKGNTLAVVFAVAESETVDALESLQSRLRQRCLASGIQTYYDAIWRHALRAAPELSCTMAGAIALSRRPLSADLLAKAFHEWERPKAAWQSILEDLGPLIEPSADGYQIRHNDVRVFLASYFHTFGADKTKAVASQLATYFRSNDADRLAAHLQLFNLLALADRKTERAAIYDVDWVIEGTVLGIDFAQMTSEGMEAAASLSLAGDWSRVVSVGCAIQTLTRLRDDADTYPQLEMRPTELPPFLPSEAAVRPFSEWSKEDFDRLTSDASELIDGGEHQRAIGLLDRWLRGLSLNEIVLSLPDMSSRHHRMNKQEEPTLDQAAGADFDRLGSLCGALSFPIEFKGGSEASRLERDALYAFEQGFVLSVTTEPKARSIDSLFTVHRPRFIGSWELAVRTLASSEEWGLVGQLLRAMDSEKNSESFLAEATWFALRSGISNELPEWLSPLRESAYGLSPTNENSSYHELAEYAPHLMVCRALGWSRLGFDPQEIADSVLQAFAPFEGFKSKADFELVFHASAPLGRIEGLAHAKGWTTAGGALSGSRIEQILTALWSSSPYSRLYQTAARLAEELATFCTKLGSHFDQAAFHAALPLAEKRLIGPCAKAIWDTVKRHGRIDVLRRWSEHYLGSSSNTWDSSSLEVRQIVDEMAPLAMSIGQDELATYASQRAAWLRISYRDRKEYSFEQASRWLFKSVEVDPKVWSKCGWKLWQLCMKCRQRDSDNHFETEIRNNISAAAIQCGAPAWWQLISTTLERCNDRKWQDDIREQIVEGTCLALTRGAKFRDQDVLPIWVIGLSLSYWFNAGETASLRTLAESLAAAASGDLKLVLREKMLGIIPQTDSLHTGDDEGNRGDAQANSPIEGSREEHQFWSKVDSVIAEATKEGRYWGLHEGLFSIALERASLHGNDVLVDGLQSHLNMHARWVFGGGKQNVIQWKELPPLTADATWEWVAVQLQRQLLNTFSSNVIEAALAGLHQLVDQNPAIIKSLFDVIQDEWSRMWLLNAAESWAVLYPDAVSSVRDQLGRDMDLRCLHLRLQA